MEMQSILAKLICKKRSIKNVYLKNILGAFDFTCITSE